MTVIEPDTEMRIREIDRNRRKLYNEWHKWLSTKEGERWQGFSFVNYLIKRIIELEEAARLRDCIHKSPMP